MHARNVEIILGPGLDDPVKYLVCWTHGGRETGGTAQGMRVARAYGVPIYNLAKPAGLVFAGRMLDEDFSKLSECAGGQKSFSF